MENQFDPTENLKSRSEVESSRSEGQSQPAELASSGEETAESEAQWFVHTCPMCQTILRTRAVPHGIRDGVLHERVETQYLKTHGSTRLWLSGGQL